MTLNKVDIKLYDTPDKISAITNQTIKYALTVCGLVYEIVIENNIPTFILHVNHTIPIYDNCRLVGSYDYSSMWWWFMEISDLVNLMCITGNYLNNTLIFNVFDYPIVRKDRKHPYSHLRNDTVYDIGSDVVYSFSSIPSEYDDVMIVFPDIMMLLEERDFSSGFTRYPLNNACTSNTEPIDWDKKKNVAVFRGGLTSCVVPFENSIRVKSHLLSLEFPNVLDSVVTKTWPFTYYKNTYTSNGVDKFFADNVRLTQEQQQQHKYVLHLDGFASAWRIVQEIFYGSVILVPDSQFSDSILTVLTPWVHYIPIKEDLSDLISIIKWCNNNSKIIKQIATNVNCLAAEMITFDNITRFSNEIIKDKNASLLPKNYKIPKPIQHPDNFPHNDTHVSNKKGTFTEHNVQTNETITRDVNYYSTLKGGAISSTSLQNIWDAYQLRSNYLRSFIEFGPFDKDGNSTITYEYLDKCKKLITVILGKKLYLKNNSELDTDIDVSQRIFDIIKSQANSERNVKILKTLQWLSRIKNISLIDYDAIKKLLYGAVFGKSNLIDVNSFIKSQLEMSLTINEILNILQYELESRETPEKFSPENIANIIKNSAYPWFQLDKDFASWLKSISGKPIIKKCDLVKLFAKSNKNPCISFSYQVWKFKDAIYLLGHKLETKDESSYIVENAKIEKVLIWIKTTKEVDSITPGEVESISKQYENIITPKTIINTIALLTTCGMKFGGKKAALSFATAPLLLDTNGIQLLRWAFSCNLENPIRKSDIDRLPKYGIDINFVRQNIDYIIAYTGQKPSFSSSIETTTTETTQTIIATSGTSPATTSATTSASTSATTSATTSAPGENVVDRLLKKVSCDISDRRYQEEIVQEQQKALEIRKRVLEEIEKQKNTPAAKTKADFTQASREELLTFVVENAKEKLPTYEELVKNPTFYKTVTDKLNAQQKTEFDKLFEKTYPDLYKLELKNNQGSQWKWPTFITEEQKTKIKADVKANNNIPLKEIMDSLNLTDEQKKELGTEWGKGLQKSLQNNVTKPNDVDQKDWDSVISGIKNGSFKQLKDAKAKGLTSKIDGNLWGKMLQQYRSKTGGGTKRNILNNRRTVRRI